MPLLNYTTKVAPHRTVAEIQRVLSIKGADAVTIEYGAMGKVRAVQFAIDVAGTRVQFRLPANEAGVLAALKRDRVPRSLQTPQHAESVAWRIVKDWVEAQLALVEANQAKLAEVFMPYAIVHGQTMYQAFEAQVAKGLLTAGNPDKETL